MSRERAALTTTTPRSIKIAIVLIILALGLAVTIHMDHIPDAWMHFSVLFLLSLVLLFTLLGLKSQRDTSQLLQTSFHVNPGLCAITDPDTGVHLDVNHTWLETLGYEKDEVLGKTAHDLNIWGGGDAERAELLELLKKEGFLHDYPTRLRAKDGALIDALVSVKLVEVGNHKRSFFSALNITKQKDEERMRRDQQAMLVAISEAAFEAVFLSEKGICIAQNTTAQKMFGYSDEEALGRMGTEWVAPEYRDLVMHNIMSGIEDPYEVLALRKDGSTFPAEIHGKMMEYRGRPVRVTSLRDITQRKEAESQLRLLSTVVEQSPVSVMVTDKDSVIEYVNAGFERITGYAAEEVVGEPARILQSGLTPEKTYEALWANLLSGDSWSGELYNKKKDGSFFWEQVHISPVTDANGSVTHYLGIKEEITLRKEQEKQILFQAHYDGLTGLPNRFLSLDRLSQSIKSAARDHSMVAVLFVDLDEFKRVNDSLGHEIGDELLVESSRRLQAAIRSQDTVGRLGGDEFIILLGGIRGPEDAQLVAEGVQEAFHNVFAVADREVVVTVSIGIAIYPNDGDSARTLLRNADTAMYHSKDMGRNAFHFYTDKMNEDAAYRLELEQELRNALRGDEFYLNYQPIIDLRHHKVVGAEVLLRWKNEKLGLVSPAEFIPIAERSGGIVEIGEFVLKRAVEEAREWFNYPNFKLALNVSPRQFRGQDLASFILGVCQEQGVPASKLEFEITEGVLMSGEINAAEALSRLREMGAGISMDDFGTGYSSLSYLRRYPFDCLKIDRSFVADVIVDHEDRELISATISMARSLGLKVIAEGIENSEQLIFLDSEGCDLGQGFYFSKPLPAEQFDLFLSQSMDRFWPRDSGTTQVSAIKRDQETPVL